MTYRSRCAFPCGLSGLAVCLLAAACGRAAPVAERHLHVFEGPVMGTYFRVQVVAGDELPGERLVSLQAAIEEELEDVNRRMSTYLPDSELSRFNRHAETTPIVLSPPTFEVLEAALEISATTGGAFDVTVAPLVEVWGFGPGGDRPDAEAPPVLDVELVEQTLARIGYGKLRLERATRSVRKSRGDLTCDLSGIAKGYAVDRVADRLLALGIDDFWVEVGGEVRTAGASPRGGSWRLGIERPRLQMGAVQRIVPVADLAVATSGDYRNYREIDGERFSHILDPRTGWPIRHRLASVSVFHPRCMIADALATAIMVLGEEEGYELALRENLPALLLVRQGEEIVERGTPAFWELAGRPTR